MSTNKFMVVFMEKGIGEVKIYRPNWAVVGHRASVRVLPACVSQRE